MRKTIFISAMLSLVLLAGCGSDSSSEKEEVRVREDSGIAVQSSSAPESSQAEINISEKADFSKITVNGKKVDIFFPTVKKFSEETKLVHNPAYRLDEKNKDYTFSGQGYSIIVKNGDTLQFESVLYVELVKDFDRDAVVPDIEQSNYYEDECSIRAVSFDAEHNGKDAQISFVGDIKLGDKRSLIEGKLGKGGEVKSTKEVYYKNEKNTFIVRYKDDTVSRITIINNQNMQYTPE